MPQLTSADQNRVDSITRAPKKSGADSWRAVNKLRENEGIGSVSVTAVHNYVNGITHTRDRPERRGKGQSKLAPSHVKKLMAVRRRMIEKANNEKRVTYADVIAEAGLDVDCAQRTMEDALRREGLSYHPARARVQVSEDDAKARLAFAEEWSKKPPYFWTNSIHGFLDCRAWPMPLTPSQRTRYAQTRVTGHLRFPHEGTDRGFTKPRQKHDWIGTPSVNVAVVVSDDRLIVFEHVKGRWNGEAARAMYTNLVGPALKKRFPDARTSARAWAFACLCVCVCVCVCVHEPVRAQNGIASFVVVACQAHIDRSIVARPGVGSRLGPSTSRRSCHVCDDATAWTVRVHVRCRCPTKFRIVEDGDRKGFKSGKGNAAKEEMKIDALTLPPRSPSLMPLDYSLWTQIDAKMAECEPTGRETKLAFLARLKRCARSLPKATVRKTVRRMKANLSALIDARGFTPKND